MPWQSEWHVPFWILKMLYKVFAPRVKFKFWSCKGESLGTPILEHSKKCISQHRVQGFQCDFVCLNTFDTRTLCAFERWEVKSKSLMTVDEYVYRIFSIVIKSSKKTCNFVRRRCNNPTAESCATAYVRGQPSIEPVTHFISTSAEYLL